MPLFVASGTDLAHVAREVELLRLAPHVAGRVFAPKDKIVRDRAKLEQALNSVVNFDCAKAFSAD